MKTMKITFEVPGKMSPVDAEAFASRIKNKYQLKILCNCDPVQMTVYGMTAEGEQSRLEDFINAELGHTLWLRIS